MVYAYLFRSMDPTWRPKRMPVAEYSVAELSAELHLVTVCPSLPFRMLVVRSMSHRTPTTNCSRSRSRGKQVLEQAATAARAQGLPVQTHLAHGETAATLLSIASECTLP